MRRGRKVLFSLALVVAVLTLAEAYFRLRPSADEYETHIGFVEPDADLLWRLAPQAGGPLATNELDLRDGPYRAHADPKILLLGDSVSWGNGVQNTRKAYPWLLEQRLQSRHRERVVEIVNSGVPGYSTFQELAYLERDGLALEPDALLLQFCLNDVTERYRALAEYGGNASFLGVDTRQHVGGIYGWLLRHSQAFLALGKVVQMRVADREVLDGRALMHDELPRALEQAWSRALGELDGIQRVAQDHDLPLLLLIPPYRVQVADPLGTRQPQDRLVAWARGHGVPVLDVLPALAGFPAEVALELFNDGTHFGEAGHAFLADLAVEPLEALVGLRGSPRDPLKRRLELARILAEEGSPRAALVVLDEAESLDPGSARVQQYRANVAHLAGDRETTLTALRRGLELDPENALLRANLARLLAE